MSQERTLYEAEQEGYGLAGSLRAGDEFYYRSTHWTTTKTQDDGSARALGTRHPDRTFFVTAADEDGNTRVFVLPVYHLLPIVYTDEHAAQIFGGDDGLRVQ